MRRHHKSILFLFIILFSFVNLTAQEEETVQELSHNRHAIEISVGLLNQINTSAEILPGSVNTITDLNGFLGSLSYTYWINRNFAFNVSVGVYTAGTDVSVSGSVYTDLSIVIPILTGVKYHPEFLLSGENFKPYISGSIGVYRGVWVQSDIPVLSIYSQTVSEAAFGGRLGFGTDIFLARWFKLGVGAGYHFVSDFENPIGAQKNYSGPEFSFAVGFVL